jgi:hypothetical protein
MVSEGRQVTSKARFGANQSGRSFSRSTLPRFDLPKFEPSRFDRLKQELSLPKFDLPRFESNNGIELPDNFLSMLTKRLSAQIRLNWSHRTTTTFEFTDLAPTESAPGDDEPPEMEQSQFNINSRYTTLPRFDLPKFESSDYARLKRAASRPKFDLPGFGNSDDLNELG